MRARRTGQHRLRHGKAVSGQAQRLGCLQHRVVAHHDEIERSGAQPRLWLAALQSCAQRVRPGPRGRQEYAQQLFLPANPQQDIARDLLCLACLHPHPLEPAPKLKGFVNHYGVILDEGSITMEYERMAGQILIADDLSLNRTVLRGKLTSACYRTITANGGVTALDLVRSEQPDLVLLDYHMPDMDGLAVCKAMRADPATRDIPVILFSATADHGHRLSALAAGADDFLAKPLDETYLLGRIRSLLRSVAHRDAWRRHPNTALQAGLADPAGSFAPQPRLALVTGQTQAASGWISTLTAVWPEARVTGTSVTEALRLDTPQNAPDLYVISPEALDIAGLHLIAELRSRNATLHAEICLILPPAARANAAMALDLGAADILTLPLDRAETRLRLERIIAHKHRADAQRRRVENQLGLAAFDPLTGLHNRNHALMRLSRTVVQDQGRFALLLIDLDRFKEINDQHGHNAGDDILKQVARRMQQDLRCSDILCRYGGEEFLLAMPRADMAMARRVADRLCARIADTPFQLHNAMTRMTVTASVGISVHDAPDAPLTAEMMNQLLETSDTALRRAKRTGRNRVICAKGTAAA